MVQLQLWRGQVHTNQVLDQVRLLHFCLRRDALAFFAAADGACDYFVGCFLRSLSLLLTCKWIHWHLSNSTAVALELSACGGICRGYPFPSAPVIIIII